MRPDLDEYEDLQQEPGEPRGRAMSWLVLGVAVVGFGALAFYAYKSGTQSPADGQMVTVQADEGVMKEAPTDAGGEQFPHKDKTIYDALSPYRTDEQKVEKLLPEPEEPVIPEPAVGATAESTTKEDTTSYVKADEGDMPVEESSPADRSSPPPVAAPVKNVAEAITPLDKPVPAPAPLEKVEVKDAPVSTAPKPATAPIVEAPKPAVTEKIEPLKKPEPAPMAKAEPRKEAAPVKKAEPAKPAVAVGGDYKIQLGAYKSDGEARQTWSKITAKHGDVIKGSPIVVKADVNGTTFYRLRASGFSSPDAAKKACATLSGRGQACFYAGK